MLRRKRLSKHKEPTEDSNAEDDVTSDDQASSAESNAEEHGNQNRSSKLLIGDMDISPPIAQCSEFQTCAVPDDPGAENTASESTESAISVRSNHLNVADKLSILRSSSFVLMQARILLLS